MRQTAPGVFFRSLGAAALLAWLPALFVCSTECSHSDAQPQQRHHHHSATAPHQHDETPGSGKNCEGHGSFCDSLSTTALSSKLTQTYRPFGLSYTLVPTFGILYRPADIVERQVFRRAKPRDWAFTPEVCLGPAFRSLAPPLASLI